MLIPIFITVAAIVVIVVIVVAMQPEACGTSRSAAIAAPPSVVFAQVNDFRNWQAWSPWAKLDPDAKIAYDGNSSGTGAVYTWSGNKKIGEGRNPAIAIGKNGVYTVWSSVDGLMAMIPGKSEPYVLSKSGGFAAISSSGMQVVAAWEDGGRIRTARLD